MKALRRCDSREILKLCMLRYSHPDQSTEQLCGITEADLARGGTQVEVTTQRAGFASCL